MNMPNGLYELNNEQFEEFLNSFEWNEQTKADHRRQFKGTVLITDDFIAYN